MTFRNLAVPAALMRGGSSEGLFFAAENLPNEPAERDRILLAAIGSPDAYGRQLDGLGGGIRIGHPAGIMHADAVVDEKDGDFFCRRASITRTARTLMRGEVMISIDHCCQKHNHDNLV
jgi:2-methylaconitate cis-trans-isomerase PrpF